MARNFATCFLSNLLSPVTKCKLSYLTACDVSVVDRWIDECWEARIKGDLYDGMIEAVKWLQREQVRPVLVSGTPLTLAKPLMQHLGITDILAAEPEIIDGKYTGALLRPHPFDKRKTAFADHWLKQNKISWNETLAMGNHFGDRHLLEKCGVAIAVAPDQSLLRIAKWHHWPIIPPDEAHSPDIVIETLRTAVGRNP